MKIMKALRIIKNIILIKIFKERHPLWIHLRITNKCTLKCSYCNIHNLIQKEISTRDIKKIVDHIEKDCIYLSLTGGEALLRDDIDEIVDYIRKKDGIILSILSNGELVKKRIETLRKIDVITLSFDGSEKVHDSIRGKGAYKNFIEAVNIAKQLKMNIQTTTVLTKKNLSEVPFILKKAKQEGFQCTFQPVFFSDSSSLQISALLADPSSFRKTILYLIRHKKEYPIANSSYSLKLYLKWPQKPKKSVCWAGKSCAFINPGGYLFGCEHRNCYHGEENNLTKHSVAHCFSSQRNLCSFCWPICNLEINNIFNLKLDSIKALFHQLRILKDIKRDDMLVTKQI